MSLSGIGDRSLLFLLLLLNKQILVGDTKITLFILHSYFGLFFIWIELLSTYSKDKNLSIESCYDHGQNF